MTLVATRSGARIPHRLGSDVILMLHGDGVNGQKTTIDDSPIHNNMVNGGTFGQLPAEISSTQSVFGGTSLYAPPAPPSGGFYCLYDASMRLTTIDWTFEFFVYLPSPQGLWEIQIGDGFQFSMLIGSDPAGAGTMSAWFHFDSSWQLKLTNYAVLPDNAWSFITLVRQGDTIYAFVDGILKTTGNFTGSIDPIGLSSPSIQCVQNSGFSYGHYIEEMRITKHARYTSNFPVPTKRFPNF